METIAKPNNTNLFNRSEEIKFDLPVVSSPKLEEHENINQIANSTFNNYMNTNILDKIDDSNGDEDNTVIIKKEPQSEPQTPVKVRVEKSILSGPTKDITLSNSQEGHTHIKKEVENDIKVKLEKIETLRTEIRNELKSAEEDASKSQPSTPGDLKILDSLPSQNSSTSFTFDSDSELLTQLQNEFELENSKIEIESEKVLSMINSKERFKYYKAQFIKIIVVWYQVEMCRLSGSWDMLSLFTAFMSTGVHYVSTFALVFLGPYSHVQYMRVGLDESQKGQ
ncbi:hypothetical protein PMKS-003190 [Pichia membranifaciens]|uniref:Uncharacterized protein n=1 Tax=Pichia membranifaciens TaxID=4926 RepID=A0A1Q2YJF8_9ASCO|nr:hypothetical protein PMKS-003190 [Pichia membranifaciens]